MGNECRILRNGNLTLIPAGIMSSGWHYSVLLSSRASGVLVEIKVAGDSRVSNHEARGFIFYLLLLT